MDEEFERVGGRVMAVSAGRNDQRVIEILDDGGWHDDGEFMNDGVRLGAALSRCLQAGLIEGDVPGYRITDAGRARLAGES